jgi:hypothetical protein
MFGGAGHPAERTVAFVIVADANSKGFYFLNIGYLGPVVCGVDFPFAVCCTFAMRTRPVPTLV